jgi:regulator of RNase E activity RraA
MTDVPTLSDHHRDLLLAASVPAIVSILWRRGYKNTLLVGPKPVNPATVRFAGPARTVHTLPLREDLLADQTEGRRPNLQARSVDQARAGDVLVVAMGGETRTAFMGDIMTTYLRVKGVVAAVLDGGVSDAAAIAGIDMPVFADGNAATPLTSHRFVMDLDVPVSCAGVTIFPGDVLVGDGNGVVAIPLALVPEIAQAAADREALEAFVIEKVRSGAPLAGTYPPNEATLKEYEAYRAARG